MEPDDLASTVGIGRYYGGDRDNGAALALVQMGGVEPQIRPPADQRAIKERMNVLVDLLGTAWRPPTSWCPTTPPPDQIVDPAGRHAADPRLLDDRDQHLLRALARFQKRWEEAALPQFSGCAAARPRAGCRGCGCDSRRARWCARRCACSARRQSPARRRSPSAIGVPPRPRLAENLPRRAYSSSSASTNLSSVIGSSRAYRLKSA